MKVTLFLSIGVLIISATFATTIPKWSSLERASDVPPTNFAIIDRLLAIIDNFVRQTVDTIRDFQQRLEDVIHDALKKVENELQQALERLNVTSLVDEATTQCLVELHQGLHDATTEGQTNATKCYDNFTSQVSALREDQNEKIDSMIAKVDKVREDTARCMEDKSLLGRVRCLTYLIEDIAVTGNEIGSDIEELLESSVKDTKSLTTNFGDCMESVYKDQHKVVEKLCLDYKECAKNE